MTIQTFLTTAVLSNVAEINGRILVDVSRLFVTSREFRENYPLIFRRAFEPTLASLRKYVSSRMLA